MIYLVISLYVSNIKFFILNNWSMREAHFNQTFGRPIP